LGVLDGSKPPTALSDQSISILRLHCAKLDQIIVRLRNRDAALFEMCASALKRFDVPRAKIYANEMVRIRALFKIISQTQLAMECIIIRLENFLDLQGVISDLKPLSKMISEVSREVSRTMPELSMEMEQLTNLINDTLSQTTIDFSQPILDISSITAGTAESEEILKEVSTMVERSLRESLPEPPSTAVAVPVSITQPRVEADGIPIRMDKLTRGREGQPIRVASYARELNLLPEEVSRILTDLDAKGKVRMEECVN
jgi:division protein CdvB (Snf7/Vps24/ESCRT-III family)